MNTARITRPRRKCTMFASTLTMGSTSAGKSTFLIRLPPLMRDEAASVSDAANHVHASRPQNRNTANGFVLVGAFGNLRQDGDGVRLHFGEAERDHEVMDLGAAAVPHLAGAERGEQRRMSREHAEVAVCAGDLDFVDGLVDQRLVRRNDLQL